VQAVKISKSVSGGWLIIRESGLILGEAWADRGDPEGRAQLWAMAEELLAVCEALRPQLYGELCDAFGYPDQWPNDRQGIVLYRRMCAAIARAHGLTNFNEHGWPIEPPDVTPEELDCAKGG
jgi:hypothetical protein